MTAELARQQGVAGGASHAPNAGSAGGADEESLPRRFGRYQLFDRIGRGGMASIYLARLESELGAERLVVVKQIHDALSRDPAFSTQFIDEAKLCAGLRHANIAQVVDLGRGPANREAPGVLFMAMEYVEGLDLQQLLRNVAKAKIPLPPEFVFHIVHETLAGLDFAHRAAGADNKPLGIVHRDVSPSNVLLSLEGEVKLCDFGIAKAYGSAAGLDTTSAEATSEATEDDAELGGARVVGKSAYMSPEHARGEALDARADVFAAGILLWEMCAGRRLYKGSEAAMLELARAADVPRLPERGLAGHAELQALLDRALAPERAARFASAKEMLDALDHYLAAHRIIPSQLRFAAFLTDHFGADIVPARRARELEARTLDKTALEKSTLERDAAEADAHERADDTPLDPHVEAFAGGRAKPPLPADFDRDFAEAQTVLKIPPGAPSPAPAAEASPAQTTTTSPSASTAIRPKPRRDPRDEPVTTAHLGVVAMVLVGVAAALGGLLFYLMTL